MFISVQVTSMIGEKIMFNTTRISKCPKDFDDFIRLLKEFQKNEFKLNAFWPDFKILEEIKI